MIVGWNQEEMNNVFNISLLPGDGIGQEISVEALKILDWFSENTDLKINVKEELVGGISVDEYDSPLTNDTLKNISHSDAILLGAVGGPKWEGLDFKKRPERGLLKIRKELDLFANFRPAIVFDALADSSTLKTEIIKNLDILIIRELTSGIYFGEPRGIEQIDEENKRGFNTLAYTTEEVKRIAKVGFETAKARSKKLCSVDKANVLESTELWREVVTEVSKDYPDVELSHMYVDNASMQLVRNPKQFDVIVTDNLFGDILSDCSAMLTGSLGMLPSASLGNKDEKTGKRHALYEPVHGSAPDIAGQGVVNPMAQILSLSMLFKYSFELNKESELINQAVSNTLDQGYRTKDILSSDGKIVGTKEITKSIIRNLDELSR